MSELSHPGARLFEPHPDRRVFINAAYMSPKPSAALEAMHATLQRMASPNFGAAEFFEPLERIRTRLAKVVGGEAARFSLTGSASFGMGTLAWNLRLNANELVGQRRRILGVNGQFPSNVQIWKRLAAQGFEFTMVEGGSGASQRLLEAIDDNTALVACAPLSWTDGRRLDTFAIGTKAKEVGALTLLDVTQSAGVDAPIPEDLPVDLVICAGYKWMLGPYGTGFMRLTADLQERLEPLEASWKNFEGADDFNRLTDYTDNFASPAAKFDHGESSAFVRLAGWEAALDVLIELGTETISNHTQDFARALRDALDLERFEMSELEAGLQATHLFRVAPRDAREFEPLSAALAAAGVSVSQRNGGWRLSPHVYNGGADIESFVRALG